MAEDRLIVERIAARPLPRLKALAVALADVSILPLVALYRIQVALMASRRDEVFQGYSQLVGLWPGFIGHYLRRAFYRWTLRRCSANCFIGFGTHFASPDSEIGENVYIGARSMIGLARLLDDVLVGSNVDILGGKRQHFFDRLDVPIRVQGGEYTMVCIGPDAWLGNGAIVGDDVGAQAIVAFGAVVVKPVPPRAIAGGNPARVIAQRESGAASPAPDDVSP
jgi:acetyltransferase-like isoleucine patch superfamily enzyme